MTLVDCGNEGFAFRFDAAEFGLFSAVLETYPAQKAPLHAVGGDKEAEELLDEALRDHRAKLRNELRAMLARKTTRSEDAARRESFTIRLTAEEVEWLLQALNDIRLGHWVILGRPDAGANAPLTQPPTGETLRSMTLLHLCTVWQGILLEGIETAAREEFLGDETE